MVVMGVGGRGYHLLTLFYFNLSQDEESSMCAARGVPVALGNLLFKNAGPKRGGMGWTAASCRKHELRLPAALPHQTQIQAAAANCEWQDRQTGRLLKEPME